MNLKANGATGMTAYFTCFPFEVAAGETFTVTVTTASKIFTKTVTVQEGRPWLSQRATVRLSRSI